MRGRFLLCGVIRATSDAVNPRYLAHTLDVAGQQARFSRTYRASIDRIAGLTIQVSNMVAQNEAIKQVHELKIEVAEALNHLEKLTEQRSKIISDFL